MRKEYQSPTQFSSVVRTRSGDCLLQSNAVAIAPPVKGRRNLDIVEGSRHIRDDPEDEKESHPRLTNDHSHVLASQTESDHADKVEHPVHRERSVAVSNWVAIFHHSDLSLRCHRIRAKEIDLESHRDETVGER
jgi:hypothetical protein